MSPPPGTRGVLVTEISWISLAVHMAGEWGGNLHTPSLLQCSIGLEGAAEPALCLIWGGAIKPWCYAAARHYRCVSSTCFIIKGQNLNATLKNSSQTEPLQHPVLIVTQSKKSDTSWSWWGTALASTSTVLCRSDSQYVVKLKIGWNSPKTRTHCVF